MNYKSPTPDKVRAFCAKHAFKIGTAFNDEFLTRWIASAVSKSTRPRVSFATESDWRLWVLASVCHECCESPAQGADPLGYSYRRSFSDKFSEMMRRHKI